jgi:hypothetical protein
VHEPLLRPIAGEHEDEPESRRQKNEAKPPRVQPSIASVPLGSADAGDEAADNLLGQVYE